MELLMVVPEADIRLPEYSIKNIINYIKPDKINIVTNLSCMDKKTYEEIVNGNEIPVDFLDNSDIYENISFDLVRNELQTLIGTKVSDYCVEWYLQQFIKLAYAGICSEEEYIVMDAAVVPLKSIDFRNKAGKPLLYSTGFVVFIKDIVNKYVNDIVDKAEMRGLLFWKCILRSMDTDKLTNMSYSVYESYMDYAHKYYSNSYADANITILYRARRMLGKFPSEDLRKWASKSYDCMILNRGDRPSETLIKINRTKLTRMLIPLWLENKVDCYFEMLSNRWAKICKFSIRETVGNETNRLRNLYRYLDGITKRGQVSKQNETLGVDGCIVLTHSGTRPIPEYAVDCIEQIRMFSDVPVYFVCSKDKVIPGRMRDVSEIIYIEDLPISDRHLKFFKKLSSFRANFDNFFQHATERFFYIYEVMGYLNLKNVIHMENDIMLYEDASVLLEKMKTIYDSITVPRMTEQFCMATVMYIPDKHRLEQYLDYVLEHILDKKSNDVYKKTNDMIMLAEYLREIGKDALPLINKGYIEEYGLINSKGEKPPVEYLKDYYGHTDDFGGVFDPQPIGQYLGGTDRKPIGVVNNVGYENEYSYIDISKLDIRWKNNDRGYYPVFIWNDREYRIYNLHVHCKELNRFRSDIKREGIDNHICI